MRGPIDWPRFLGEHGIEFDERGPSVKRNNINVICPWCRDGTRLLGIELSSTKFACWKNERHRGSNADYFVAQLLSVTRAEALDLLGLKPPPSLVEDLVAQLAALNAPAPVAESTSLQFPTIELPNVFFKLRANGVKSSRFIDYLASRGLGPGAIERYDLWASRRDLTGDVWAPLKDRVGIPLYSPDRRVIGYTARSIDGHARRYHTEPANAAGQSIWFEQLATGGLVLVIVEGQFDAMTIDWAAHCYRLPVHAVALGGTARTRGKFLALERLARKYRKTVVLLDTSATHRALRIQTDMSVPVMLGQLPAGVGDPGELRANQTRQLLDGWCSSSVCA